MKQKLRIGLIGLGQRGMATLRRYAFIEDAEIVALADLVPHMLEEAQQLLTQQGNKSVKVYQGESQWRRLCTQTDVDLVYICTDWSSHARMAIHAMK